METTLIKDPELGEISWKAVDLYYKNMSSPDTETRKQANQWLINFYASEHSDKIATELLEFGDQSNQLLGISLIDAKINKTLMEGREEIMYFDPDFQKPKTSKFTKKAMAFREDLFMGVSMVEKIMRRTNLLAYSREMDKFIDPYGIELFLYHLKEQITVTYTPYNLNIDYNPDRQQVFSSQM